MQTQEFTGRILYNVHCLCHFLCAQYFIHSIFVYLYLFVVVWKTLKNTRNKFRLGVELYWAKNGYIHSNRAIIDCSLLRKRNAVCSSSISLPPCRAHLPWMASNNNLCQFSSDLRIEEIPYHITIIYWHCFKFKRLTIYVTVRGGSPSPTGLHHLSLIHISRINCFEVILKLIMNFCQMSTYLRCPLQHHVSPVHYEPLTRTLPHPPSGSLAGLSLSPLPLLEQINL